MSRLFFPQRVILNLHLGAFLIIFPARFVRFSRPPGLISPVSFAKGQRKIRRSVRQIGHLSPFSTPSVRINQWLRYQIAAFFFRCCVLRVIGAQNNRNASR